MDAIDFQGTADHFNRNRALDRGCLSATGVEDLDLSFSM
jgi:hypothetical protein